MAQPNQIEISFRYLVSVEGDQEASKQDLSFRLGYDEAEIPISDDLLDKLKDEISQVLPAHMKLDRIGGLLSLNGSKIKTF
jgi:hypothetical protein|tara:strand:+ start:166 stop:408 length:243 start_codon:yes stop_codon:yes gene_type:complete